MDSEDRLGFFIIRYFQWPLAILVTPREFLGGKLLFSVDPWRAVDIVLEVKRIYFTARWEGNYN